ncbi:MAG: hypothetical protein DID92_2727744050 [Candidatus Nitrotoga sp. SPKER]|nr:MAG: hypothetical protein DID92_2727744050 [Candidatus Nitrotoga sp. SPKER]
MTLRFLLSGHDTIECAYYLAPTESCLLDYEQLAVQKESIRLSKSRTPSHIQLGCEEFMLAGHGTGSGYPFLIENEAFSIQFGEFNVPSFFVTFRSIALWHSSAQGLHERFLAWAQSLGLQAYMPETLSRVDFTFDYHLPVIDFDEDNFVSSFAKDNQHRKNGKIQTFRLGEGDLALRIYNKSDEIEESSFKTWFYELWGMEQDVWRIEWQARKKWLRLVGIRTFEDLKERQGDLLRFLMNSHTTLRIKTDDSNRSRWPLHTLWQDLQERIAQMEGLGVVRELDRQALLDERMMRIAISMYGYMKRIAAIYSLKGETSPISLKETRAHLAVQLERLHDPLTWETGVQRRITEMRLGEG